jgi:uridine phosphorylase
LRLNIQDESLNSKMDNFKFEEQITNLEMETAAIYGLSTLLGHNISMPLLPIVLRELSALIHIKLWTN